MIDFCGVDTLDIFDIGDKSFEKYVKDYYKIAQKTDHGFYDVIIFMSFSEAESVDKFFELYDRYLFEIFNEHFFIKG